jgi:Flp pilus assembly protein TadD
MAAAWQWGLSGPPAPAPWNRFGALLEKRGDLRGALEAYRKSLAVEWNQPPIMNAVRRLETQVQ